MTETRDDDLTGGALTSFEGLPGRRPGIPREVELKYLVRDVEALRTWLDRGWGGALDGLEFGNERTVEVEDRYIDTAYGALGKAGFGARLRREDDGPYTVTVKSSSHDRPADAGTDAREAKDSKALSQRVEVEGPANERLDPDKWPSSAARELINEIRDGARMRLLFTINQRREKKTLALDDGPVQLALDRVAVFRGGRPLASFSVLELEVSGGSGADLNRLAGLVEATGFVVAEPRSKEEIARHYVARRRRTRIIGCPRCPPRRGSRRTTRWARRGARSCACTSRACSISRLARARERTPRTCTSCAWPRVACAPHGASSMAPTGPRSNVAT